MEIRRQVSNELKLRRYVLNTALVLSLFYVFGTLVFSDMGFLRYMEIKGKHQALSMEFQDMDSSNEQLRASLAKHKSNTFYLEKHARENFGLSGPEEIIFLYK
ncbi:MAG: septum formation initiator family protein [Thermodesulfovibrionales bacterium]|nr:septum formation initiator family protein [Thermodesulfovibrionales bacterium]